MNNKLKSLNIKMFVFGTLRKNERLEFYMEGGNYKGLYYTEGQLMKAENGSVQIDFEHGNIATIGELHYVNFHCLQRINHLEAVSGEFPKGYDLAIIPIWELKEPGKYTFDKTEQTFAFFYRRRERPFKILNGDYTTDFNPVIEIKRYLTINNVADNPEKIIEFYKTKLLNMQF